MDSRQKTKLLNSLANILKSGYHVLIDGSEVTIVIEDRLLDEDSLMRMFECLWIYGYKEQELAYANRRHIGEFELGEQFSFIER